MIGLIAAEKAETSDLIKIIKAKIIEFNGIRYYIGKIKENQVVVCFSGVGKANAAMAAMNMIINFSVDKIFNIGLAGACKTSIPPKTILIADKLQYGDVDLTSFNYQINQLPDEPLQFKVKDQYIHFLKSIIDNPITGVIASSDSIISLNNIEYYPFLASPEIVGFDMEAASIAQVCNKTNTDFFCVKIVSDNLSFSATSRKQYDINFKAFTKEIQSIALKVLEYYSC